MTVWTIGHSTRSLASLIRILESHELEVVVDVRRFPASRRVPQFNSREFAGELIAHGIDYQWIPALGGRRRSSSAAADTDWRHPAFRAYAEYSTTEEFAEGLFELTMIAGGLRTVIMCAEALWWRCHRRIIADVLTSLGVGVVHLRDEQAGTTHRLAAPAHLVGGALTYSARA